MKEELIYHMRIELNHSDPQIWRTFKISNLTPMQDFHLIIQSVMGWTNSHLHQFIVKGRIYAEPDEFMEYKIIDYTKLTISNLIKAGGHTMKYEYDFGDGWMHTVKLEKISILDKISRLPVCTGGAGSCPPEDSGGISGYYQMLNILKNPNHEEYLDYQTWLGGDFNPDYFDIDFVNGMLLLDNYGTVDPENIF